MQQVKADEIWDLVCRTTRRAGLLRPCARRCGANRGKLHGKSSVGLEHLFYYFRRFESVDYPYLGETDLGHRFDARG